MVRLLTSLGAALGQESQGTILQLDGFPSELADRERIRIPVLTEALGRYEGDIISNVFVTSWSGNQGERIVASFTEAISTFSGQPIVRVQFTSNGQLPNREILKDALASLVMAGRTEISARKHLSNTNVWNLDDARMVMRIHALNEPEIGLALKEIGAKPRMIGIHPMLPVMTNFKNTPKNVLGFAIPIATPFVSTPLVQVREQRPRRKLEAEAPTVLAS
jgi:hypothetical protein